MPRPGIGDRKTIPSLAAHQVSLPPTARACQRFDESVGVLFGRGVRRAPQPLASHHARCSRLSSHSAERAGCSSTHKQPNSALLGADAFRVPGQDCLFMAITPRRICIQACDWLCLLVASIWASHDEWMDMDAATRPTPISAFLSAPSCGLMTDRARNIDSMHA